MLHNAPSGQLNTFQNPVHGRPCPDPFVLKYAGEYWCYCTGLRPDGGAFGILHSTDLVHWREVGSALAPLPGGHTCYWAPEVTYDNGRFYLYYSVGNEVKMAIRVAVAEHPAGPFVDSGHVLTREEFAIDGHVFIDDDGQRYLFYATDFLSHTHVGTGLVADRMLDPFALAGEPQPVTRARYDWQVYDPQRKEKGGVRWHTVEGPFVLKRKGRYYLMFSGGNWQNVTYGVGYAVSDQVLPEDEWEQAADGHKSMPILRTLPEAGIIGPGHNSVVRGPDNQQLWCVYHRWSREVDDRVLAVDRLEWVGDRLMVIGPTHRSQPAPAQPAINGFGAEGALDGEWRVTNGRLEQTRTAGEAWAEVRLPGGQWVVEVTLRALGAAPTPARLWERVPPAMTEPQTPTPTLPRAGEHRTGEGGGAAYGLALRGAAGEGVMIALRPGLGVVTGEADGVEDGMALPASFDFTAEHRLRVEVDGERACAVLNEGTWRWTGRMAPAQSLALFTRGTGAEFSGLAVTLGWQDDFDEPLDPAELGWQPAGTSGQWTVRDGELRQAEPAARGCVLVKGEAMPAYELVVNGRVLEYGEPGPGPGGWGLYPAYASADDTGPLFTVEPHQDRWNLVWRPGRAPDELEKQDTVWLRGHVFPLPADFDPYAFQQFRFRLEGGQLAIQWAGQPLGGIQAPARPGRVALYADRAAAGWEMVRVTGL
jgi:GH43 family beta-xylosidase